MSYQGFTAEDGKYEVLLELTGQVYIGLFFMYSYTDRIKTLTLKK
jgi:hypothetical protein